MSVKKVLIFSCLLSTILYADGLFHARSISSDSEWYLHLKSSHVSTYLNNQVGTTFVRQTFVNNLPDSVTATYYFPMPVDGNAAGFAFRTDSVWVEASIKPGEQDTISGPVEPSELEELKAYLGENPFMVALDDTLPPGAEVQVRMEYVELVPYNFGLVEYTYPMWSSTFQQEPQDSLLISVTIESQRIVDSVGVNIPSASIDNVTDYGAEISYLATSIIPQENFTVSLKLSQEDLGVWVMTYDDVTDTNFFLMIAEPPSDMDSAEIIPKNFVFIIDKSGSMSPENKLPRVKEAAIYCVTHLNEADFFNLIAYNQDIYDLFSEPVPAKQANIDSALSFINKLQAEGATNIYEALMTGLKNTISEGFLNMIVFLTDGLPTAGVTNPETIWTDVADSNGYGASIYTFGVGSEWDINPQLLEWIAYLNRGIYLWAKPDGPPVNDIIVNFFRRVGNPVLTDLEVSFGSLETWEVYPQGVLNLFAGTQLLLAGQYGVGGPTTVEISGHWLNSKPTYTFDVDFTEGDTTNAFLPRFWAKQKIDYLLQLIRLHGESDEWVDEIIQLSLRYGIQTPYTHFGWGDFGDDETGDDFFWPGGLGEDETDIVMPKTPILYPNYPNPFNATTVFKFYIPEPMRVIVRIYDIRGVLVWTMVFQIENAGEYSFNWDGKTNLGRLLSSGVYMVQFTFKDRMETRKILLLR